MKLDDFLAEPTKPIRCFCCKNSELNATIVAYLDKLRSGQTRVSLTRLHQGYLLPNFGGPKHVTSVANHVRSCLSRNPMTGESL